MQGTTENCLLTILIERSAHPLTAPLPSLLSPESGRFAPRRPGDQPPGPPLGHPTDSCPTAEFTGPPCIIVITWPKRQAPPPTHLNIPTRDTLTRHLSDLSVKPLVFSRWSTSRPGVAITTCGFLASIRLCAIMSMPPTMTQHLTPIDAPATRGERGVV